MITIAERVARGAALLDEREPGWWQRINVRTLDIRSCKRCVLGQLEGWPSINARFDPSLGFDAGEGSPQEVVADFNALTAEWRRLIKARRAGERDA